MNFCAWYKSIFVVWRYWYEKKNFGPCDGLHIALGKHWNPYVCKG